ILCVPEGYSREKMKVMEAFGGEIKYVSQEAGMQAAIDLAHELAGQIEGSFVPQQFANPANANFHEQTTAQEIIEQMDGRIDAIAMGAGTAGTFTGVARALKKINPQTLCVLVEPEGSIFGGGAPGSHKVEGIGQSQFIPANLDYSVADEIMMIYDDEAYATVRYLAETEGVLCGGSSGVAAAAARRLAERLGAGQRIVTLFPDGAERYMSQGIFD
ncbi:MAG: cysteine synthase family protein, partial [Acidobacteriota bacterium]|nr:cysteine synthase family protein [Acidobacteriota bacterium]